jgi:transglutaminase-like putative cysteine protease
VRSRTVSLAFAYALAAVAGAAVALAPLPRSTWLLPAFGCVVGILWDRLERSRIPAAVLNLAGLAGSLAFLLPPRRETLAEQSLGALALLLAVKLLGAKGRRDHLQILAVSLLLVAGCASLEPEVGFAALLLASIALAVLFLLWLPFSEAIPALDARLGRRIVGIGARLLAGALPLAALLFVILPRAVNPFWAALGANPRAGVSGVSDQLRLGDVGRVALSGAVAFRAEIEGGPLPATPYWRGAVLEVTDGRRWSVSPLWRPAVAAPPETAATRVTYHVEPHGDRQLFLLEAPLRASVGARTQLLGAGRVLRLPLPLARRLRYTGSSYPADRYAERLTQEDRALNLALPAGLPASIRELALRIAAGEREPQLVTQRLLAHFSQGYTYALQVPATPGDPLEAFLLVDRTGYCEYFAAGLVTLLRICGVPARVVSGYLGGDFVPAGSYYRVTQASAHAWAEAWLDGAWVRLDATPAAGELGATFASRRARRPLLWLDALRMRWNSWIVQYDAESQLELARAGAARVRGLRRLALPDAGAVAGIAGAALALAALAVAGVRARRRADRDPLARRFARFERLAARHGCAREPWEGPLDHAARLAAAHPAAAAAARRFGEIAAGARYGRRAADAALLAQLDKLLAHIAAAGR